MGFMSKALLGAAQPSAAAAGVKSFSSAPSSPIAGASPGFGAGFKSAPSALLGALAGGDPGLGAGAPYLGSGVMTKAAPEPFWLGGNQPPLGQPAGAPFPGQGGASPFAGGAAGIFNGLFSQPSMMDIFRRYLAAQGGGAAGAIGSGRGPMTPGAMDQSVEW